MPDLEITSNDFQNVFTASIHGTLFSEMSLTIRNDGRYHREYADVREICKRHKTEIVERMTSLISYNVAPYVTSWTFRGNSGSSDDPYHILTSFQENEALPAFFDILPNSLALTKLTLVNIKIDEGVLESLGELGWLRTLHLDQVLFGCRAVLPEPLHLTELCIDSYDTPGVDDDLYEYAPEFAIQSQNHIETLRLNCAWTSDLARSVLGAIEETGRPCIKLHTLELTVTRDDVFELFHFLNCCPALEALTIRQEVEYYIESSLFSTSNVLEDHAIPFLMYFNGPVEFGAKITKGRPLRSLTLAADPQKGCYPMDKNIIEVLESVKGPLMRILEFGSINLNQGHKLLYASVIDKSNMVTSRFQNLRILRLEIDDIPPGDEKAAHILIDTILEECRIEDIDEYEDDFGPQYDEDEKPRSRCPLRDPSGELSISTHYQRMGYLLLLANVAAGVFPLPQALEELRLVQSRLFKRFTYTEAHEVAMIEEFGVNEVQKGFVNLRFITIGISTKLNLGWRKDSNHNWVRREEN